LASDELKSIYLQKVEEMNPNIRYCAYNIGDETAIKDLVDMKLKSTGSELAGEIDVISFFNLSLSSSNIFKKKQTIGFNFSDKRETSNNIF
jgi:hypothetical protein